MKIIVDNNISFRVAKRIGVDYVGSVHVSDLRMDADTDDIEIWNFAKQNGFTILTKDNDFEAMSRLFGCPPKVLQLICGNEPTSVIVTILEKYTEQIKLFDLDNESCLMYLNSVTL